MSSKRISERNPRRIDYKTLNDTGERIDKKEANKVSTPQKLTLQNESEKSPVSKLSLQLSNLQFDDMDESKNQSMNQESNKIESQIDQNMNEQDQEIIKLESKFIILLKEIDDHIDENPINKYTVSIEDIDNCVDKIEKLRSQQRTVNREIANKLKSDEYDCKFGTKYEITMANIKEYIIHAKERKSAIRQADKAVLQNDNSSKAKKEAEEISQKKRSAEFLINEVLRITSELHTEFSKEKENNVSDEEIMRRKDDLPSNLLKLNQLSTKFQRCLESIPETYDQKEEVIKEMNDKYE